MNSIQFDIEIISAPSILGLKPTGVEKLGDCLLATGLAEKLEILHPVLNIPSLNHLYSNQREQETNCLNTEAIKDFSLQLSEAISEFVSKKRFAFVLGGDCSILLGIMPGLKSKGTYGIIFLDAHADFYEPEKSITGEIADMELGIITGRGPSLLTNINDLQPYVKEENVVHIGQRDQEETKKYGCRDIRDTKIKCFSLADIEKQGMDITISAVLQHISRFDVEGFWIHFDTDVLSDEINPAVDYRLPGGLQFEQVEELIRNLLLTGKIAGISITIFNPTLDETGLISKNIVKSLCRAFE